MAQTDRAWHHGVDAAGGEALAAIGRRPGLRRNINAWDGSSPVPSSLYQLLTPVWKDHSGIPQKRADLYRLCRIYAASPLPVPSPDHHQCNSFAAIAAAHTSSRQLLDMLNTRGTIPQILNAMAAVARDMRDGDPVCPALLWRDIRSLRYDRTINPRTGCTRATGIRTRWARHLLDH